MVKRSSGRSSVAAAAYRSAEKLHCEYLDVMHSYPNAVNAAAYRSGESLHNEQADKIHDYTYKRGVVFSEIILPENAPLEYADRSTLWNAVESSEKRKDAQTARDIDVALPVEFDRQEQIEIMQEYIRENFVDRGMVADFAIHDTGNGNPHAHILLTTREISADGFGKKNREWNKKPHLESWRKNWADTCNERLKAKGLDERIDHRTLKAQGIDREPTIHIGVTAKAMQRKGIMTERVKRNNEIISRNEMRELKRSYSMLDKETSKLETLTAEARREEQALRVMADQIIERAEEIKAMGSRLAQRPDKKLERSYEKAVSHFKREYHIYPDQAGAEVERLTAKADMKRNLQDKLREKLTPLAEEKKAFALEYKRRLKEAQPEQTRVEWWERERVREHEIIRYR
jgi:ATP-dependent exoDNAse (exonuclease V) alpha subunit